MEHNFGENKKEYYPKTKEYIDVIQSPKYIQAKQKAIEIIEKGNYGLIDSDFWILMNATQTGKMMYTGLVLSHNGCLKINNKLEDKDKFKPACVMVDKDGYADSLVFIYNNEEQGIFEVGEVNSANCKISYPYAMALKRCFDRVVLKTSKLAFSGIVSESELQGETTGEEVLMSKKQADKLLETLAKAGFTPSAVLKKYKIRSFAAMTQAQFYDCMEGLEKELGKKPIKDIPKDVPKFEVDS